MNCIEVGNFDCHDLSSSTYWAAAQQKETGGLGILQGR